MMTKKASWDQAEILDLHDKYTQICKRFPNGVIPAHTAIVPELLKMVHADGRAISIYHRRHIIHAGRMSNWLYAFNIILFFLFWFNNRRKANDRFTS